MPRDGVIVCDSSCLIHLRRGRLVDATIRLSYRFVIPYPIRQDELLHFTAREWQRLERVGIVTYDIPADRMEDAFALKNQHPGLSACDCFAFIAAQCHEDSILLTGDRNLRRVAEKNKIRVHGVLWLVDELRNTRLCDEERLIEALETWRDDESVFLPRNEIDRRLRRLRRKG